MYVHKKADVRTTVILSNTVIFLMSPTGGVSDLRWSAQVHACLVSRLIKSRQAWRIELSCAVLSLGEDTHMQATTEARLVTGTRGL